MKVKISKIERELIKDLKPAFNYMKRNGMRNFVIEDKKRNQIIYKQNYENKKNAFIVVGLAADIGNDICPEQ